MNLLALLPTLLLAPAAVDVRVDGEGYLRFVREGRVVYAKAATLHVQNGKVCHTNGPAVIPTLAAPNGASLEVDLEGYVRAAGGGLLGRLVLALFPTGTTLAESGGFATCAERPHVGNPGEDTNGVIRSGGKPVEAVRAPVPSGPKPATADPRPSTGITKGAVVTVRPATQVAGESILLGEVATIEGEGALAAQLSSVVLGDTPPLGIARILDRDRIVTRIRAAKIETADLLILVPERAEARRKAATVTHDQFVKAATAFVLEKLGAATPVRSPDTLPDMDVPEGTLELRAQSMSQNGANLSVVVSVQVDGKPLRSRTVRLLTDLAEAGVRQGATVKVLLRSGGAVIETTGTARKTGLVGQSVEVDIKLDQRTTHTGIVTAPGIVEVKL